MQIKRFLIFLISVYLPLGGQAQLPDIKAFTNSMEKHEGYFNFYWDNNSGKIWLEVDKIDEEFLYVSSLPAGIGSNDIGLDRGQLGGTKVVKFIKSGPKLLLTQVNYDYRAITENLAERKSVDEAFAQSIIGGFKISASTKDHYLVDATDFLLRDAHNYALGPEHSIIQRLKSTNQGDYSLDLNRSAIYMDGTKNFPLNSEFEVVLTFELKSAQKISSWAGSVVPSAESISVRQHHSFIKLPDDGFQMRRSDPRSGYHGISFHDYATPIDQPLKKYFIHRHRLKKKDPSAAMSEALDPIVYYVDRGAPEPIRSALIEGASWWNQAFEAAGFQNAFRVELLPEGIHRMDIRYNVIQWVHRSTRGWSYGMTVADPRTGEILKGHVSLGSLRVRQDLLIAQGLLEAYKDDQQDPRMIEMALSRLRQLSAHEVGHTLGLYHNFAASTDQRSSVMDYPHPLLTLGPNGALDFSQVYDDKIGAWDKQAIKYGYMQFPKGTKEAQSLQSIIEETLNMGLHYITDRDARPAGGAHPLAHLWDNGTNPSDEMKRMLELRQQALNQFGKSNIRTGQAWSSLEEVLVPLYLSHRYQLEAVSKIIGGLDYTYAVKGDGQFILKELPKDFQLSALQALLMTLDPEVLEIPEHILQLIPPKSPNDQRGRESFKSRTGVIFDPMAAAESAASTSIAFLFHPQRVTRLAQQKLSNPNSLGLDEVIESIYQLLWKSDYKKPIHQAIANSSAQIALNHLMQLTENSEVSLEARAIANAKILELETWIISQTKTANEQLPIYEFALKQIARFKQDPQSIVPYENLTLPDGSPIGGGFHCLQGY